MARAYMLLFDGYADWELGNVLAELRRLGQLEVVSVGFAETAVISMGGLRVTIDMALSEVDLNDVLIFIIPGGYMWEGDYPFAEIDSFLKRLLKAQIPVAAICAATTVLARAGLFKDRKHTSNSKKYLSKMYPQYADGANYVDALSIRDRHVITASGLGSVDFAMEILEELDLATAEIRTLWYEAFKQCKYPDNI